MDTRAYNREAWNREVEGGENRWSQPVDAETIAKAKQGEFSILLTENIPVPQKWFPPLKGADVLCLASGGGQQGPVLAAAGANVTVFDNSPRQLEQDQLVAEREALQLENGGRRCSKSRHVRGQILRSSLQSLLDGVYA